MTPPHLLRPLPRFRVPAAFPGWMFFSYLFSPFYLPGLSLLHLKTPRLFPVPELLLPFLFHRQIPGFPSGSPWQQTVLSRLCGYLLPSCRFSFPIPLFPEQSLSRLHPAAPVPAFRLLFLQVPVFVPGFPAVPVPV